MLPNEREKKMHFDEELNYICESRRVRFILELSARFSLVYVCVVCACVCACVVWACIAYVSVCIAGKWQFHRFNVQPSWILSQSKKCRVAVNKPLINVYVYLYVFVHFWFINFSLFCSRFIAIAFCDTILIDGIFPKIQYKFNTFPFALGNFNKLFVDESNFNLFNRQKKSHLFCVWIWWWYLVVCERVCVYKNLKIFPIKYLSPL